MGLISSVLDKFSVVESRPTTEEVKETANTHGDTHIAEEGDPGCSHNMVPDHWYDVPDPNPNNPIRVKMCENCPREVHIATPAGSTSTIDLRYIND